MDDLVTEGPKQSSSSGVHAPALPDKGVPPYPGSISSQQMSVGCPPGYYCYHHPYPYPYSYVPPRSFMDRYASMSPREAWWRSIKWGVGESILALVLIFVLYYTVSLIPMLVAGLNYRNISVFAYVLLMCPLLAASAYFIAHRKGQGLKELGLRSISLKREIGWGTLGGLLALIGNVGLFYILWLIYYLATGERLINPQMNVLKSQSGMMLVLYILSIVVFAPIFEELFFRGVLYPPLRNKLGRTQGMVLLAFIFAFLHFQLSGLLSLFMVGLIITFLYDETGSLYPSIIAHAINNTVVLITMLLLG